MRLAWGALHAIQQGTALDFTGEPSVYLLWV